MGKVAILTINDYENYGNRLQNYAAQEVLKSLGFSVETIINNSNQVNFNKTKFSEKLNKLKKMDLKEVVSRFNGKISQRVYKENKIKRVRVFKEFTSTFIQETNFSINERNIPNNLADMYDYFITGSDQVWNPTINHRSSLDFLTFAPKNKRIAYSPSFGVAEIPTTKVDMYKSWISGMDSLSVREAAGAEIIKNLTGRVAPVLVDPTLMLTKDKWLSVAKKADNKPTKKYLLTYFLGSISKENKAMMEDLANRNNLEIINLAKINEAKTYATGPSEFVDYINSAAVMCTDSFHGSVFSIILETPFIVFERGGSLPSMNSRIDTLLGTFKLESRLSRNMFSNEEEIFNIDYSHTHEILDKERNKAFEYLKGALKVK